MGGGMSDRMMSEKDAGRSGHMGQGMGMEDRMSRMQQLMDEARTTRDPDRHRQLMREHMDEMMEGMRMMGSEGRGMMGGDEAAAGDMMGRMDAMQRRMDMMQHMMEQMMQHEREQMRMMEE